MESTIIELNIQIGQPPRRYRTDHSHDWDMLYGAVGGLLVGTILTAGLLTGRPSTPPPATSKTAVEAIRPIHQAEVMVTKAPKIYLQSENDHPAVEVVMEDSSDKVVPSVHTQTFVATAYCSCEKCCGKWALNRDPGPVIGAAGTPLITSTSVAVDPSVYTFGTTFIDQDGHEYIAADTGSGVNGNHIDIYMASHEEALQWGVRYIELEVKT